MWFIYFKILFLHDKKCKSTSKKTISQGGSDPQKIINFLKKFQDKNKIKIKINSYKSM
jgi:hypothetical protein